MKLNKTNSMEWKVQEVWDLANSETEANGRFCQYEKWFIWVDINYLPGPSFETCVNRLVPSRGTSIFGREEFGYQGALSELFVQELFTMVVFVTSQLKQHIN